MDQRSSVPPPYPPVPAAKDVFQKAAATAQPRPAMDESSIKDTVESILVAFILAFIFRAFIVEAFVIPTGSMAPTLLGAHMRFNCDDCGYAFETNYSAQNDPDGNPIIPARSGRAHQVNCPNCGFPVPRKQSENVPVNYGDRILVLKYLYLFEDPKRWDVVVFKSPYHVPDYTQNYIKRLVGRPNESIVILDGDVYVAPAADARDISDFVIQTKPRHVQQALWRVVYDNDHHPRGLSRAGGAWKQPWTLREGSGWDLDGTNVGREPRTFSFDNPTGGGTIFFDREASPANYPFSDWLAYDIEASWQPQVVGDLKLKFDYTRSAGDGPLRMRLTKGTDTFIAELTPSAARLLKRGDNNTETELATAPLSTGSRPVRVEFQNVDYRVALSVNGDELLHTTPEQYKPDTAALLDAFNNRDTPPLPVVVVSAERQTSQVQHLSLWRDVHYLNRGGSRTPQYGTRSSKPFWASPSSFPENVMHLGPKEYFVLGDNSLMSLDARGWADDIDLPDFQVESGRVPDRFMLGKAFFVYWPAGYKPASFAPAITPNFGDMRFIR
ncbi:MAG: S26 family signal peptidase [Tepidisphaeraceae bacterium]